MPKPILLDVGEARACGWVVVVACVLLNKVGSCLMGGCVSWLGACMRRVHQCTVPLSHWRSAGEMHYPYEWVPYITEIQVCTLARCCYLDRCTAFLAGSASCASMGHAG
jgi:hypothetical protein